MGDAENELPARDSIKIGLMFGGLVVVLWLATPFVVTWLYSDIGSRGQFGDLFGSINALFSGLAFVGVIVAILLQKQELGFQRQELQATREELQATRLETKRAADAQEASQQALNKTLSAQSYKLALDILEQRHAVYARRNVWLQRNTIMNHPYESWSDELKESAELVSRTFESVGSMVVRGLLPADYFVESSWSMPVAKQWKVLRAYNHYLRDDWGDPHLAEYFEYLGEGACKYLEAKGIKVKYL